MKDEVVFSKEHLKFFTVTCLECKHILKEDRIKDITFVGKPPAWTRATPRARD
jgi:hypothetical protein